MYDWLHSTNSMMVFIEPLNWKKTASLISQDSYDVTISKIFPRFGFKRKDFVFISILHRTENTISKFFYFFTLNERKVRNPNH